MTPNGFQALRVRLDDGIVYDLYHVRRNRRGKVEAIWPDKSMRIQDMNDIPEVARWLHRAHELGAVDEDEFWECLE